MENSVLIKKDFWSEKGNDLVIRCEKGLGTKMPFKMADEVTLNVAL